MLYKGINFNQVDHSAFFFFLKSPGNTFVNIICDK